jgi:DNA-binding response OmpR family regulator
MPRAQNGEEPSDRTRSALPPGGSRSAPPSAGPRIDLASDPLPARRSSGGLIARAHQDPYRDILLIEDDEDTALALAEALRGEGYTVDAACDGEQGLIRLPCARYRLLLLDLIMPRVNGMQVLRVVRARPAIRPRAVVVLSACSHSGDIRGALTEGADDYLTKPLDIHDLLIRAGLWIERADAVDALPSAAHPSAGARIYSLGRFSVERDGMVCLHAGSRARKATTLFKFLLARHGRVVPTDEIFALLWPDAVEEVAATDLRSLLHQLRRTLGLTCHGESRLEHTGATLSLQLGPADWWDVAEFEACLGEATRRLRAGDIEAAIASYTAGVALYAGEYLAEDTYATWAIARREHLRQEWLHALAELARLHGERGRQPEQEAALRALVRADPYREESQRALMRLLSEEGRGAEALVLYRELEDRLHAEFGAHPDPKTRAVALHIGQSSLAAIHSL